MSARLALLATAAALAAWVGWGAASPDPYTWRREILLGGNEKEHFYLLLTHGNPGTYYVGFDSVFVCERSNSDPRWTQLTLLRATSRTTNASTGEQSAVEAFVADFDVAQFLVEHNSYPAFFETMPESIAIDSGGMYYHERGARSYVMTGAEMRSWVNLDLPQLLPNGEKRRLVGMYQTTAPPDSETGRVDFFLVRSGEGMDDAGQVEGIVPAADSRVRAAVEEVRQKLLARKKPRAAHK